MAKSTENKVKKTIKTPEASPSIYDYFRFGESYTSLILGIIVVIVGTILLLSLVRNRNVPPVPDANQQTMSTSTTNAPVRIIVSQTDEETIISSETAAPTNKQAISPTSPPVPTKKAESKKVVTPTTNPTPTKVIKKTEVLTPTKPPQKTAEKQAGGKTYVVISGDTLWKIAENEYGSGYNWVDIARVNKLSNSDLIEKGMKLSLPKVDQKIVATDSKTEDKDPSKVTIETSKITGTEYTVKENDSLWNISVRAYGDGFQWVKIKDTNNLSNPDLIYPGNRFIIPRS